MSSPYAYVKLPTDGIRVLRGETLTVWLNTSGPEAKAIQVELRITTEGKPEVYLREDDLHIVMPFAEWHPGNKATNVEEVTQQ